MDVGTAEVGPAAPEYVQINGDMLKAGLTLTKLVRIQNSRLAELFEAESQHLKKIKPKDYELNITELYHGTTAPQTIIYDEGLDDRLSRPGRLGSGIYFSDNPLKCTQYAGETKTDQPYMLKCKVILGDIKEYEPNIKDKHAEQNLLRGAVDGKRVYYDSVKGVPYDFTEYVVFERRRMLIEYAVFYTSPKQKKHKSKTGSSASAMASSERGYLTMAPHERFTPPSTPPRYTPPSSPRFTPPRSPAFTPPLSPERSPRATWSPNWSRPDPYSYAAATGGDPLTDSDLEGSTSEREPCPDPIVDDVDVAEPVTAIEDDATDEVMDKLIMEFKDATCCDDDRVCRRFIDQSNWDINVAVSAYFDQ